MMNTARMIIGTSVITSAGTDGYVEVMHPIPSTVEIHQRYDKNQQRLSYIGALALTDKETVRLESHTCWDNDFSRSRLEFLAKDDEGTSKTHRSMSR